MTFPLTPQQAAPPSFSLTPPVSLLNVADPNLKVPRTYEWNFALEQAIGAKNRFSLTYLGSSGRICSVLTHCLVRIQISPA